MSDGAIALAIIGLLAIFIFIIIAISDENEKESDQEESENTNAESATTQEEIQPKHNEQLTVSTKPKVKYCPDCGSQNDLENNFCVSCGKKLVKETAQEEVSQNNQTNNTEPKRDLIVCPKCGSTNIHFVTTQASQNFDAGDACCGYALCGAPGLLCGVKKKTESNTVRKCMSCNHEF